MSDSLFEFFLGQIAFPSPTNAQRIDQCQQFV
jgi:hypothetical protein